jgi:hypothetical protein
VNRSALENELFSICNSALQQKGKNTLLISHKLKITAQGGIGTANEHKFLIEHYNLDSIGWGSPFLLVPEATNVDDETLTSLVSAQKQDYYLSAASPLGVPFNNFKQSSSEKQRVERIEKGRPGSPCYKKFLSSNTEFTEKPICTASREYQHLKINQLKSLHLPQEEYEAEFNKITEKDCLCEGLSIPPLLKNQIPHPHKLKAVAICPGPNLAYFSGIFSLKQMVDHIYGRINILNSLRRSNVFINELRLYVDYLKKKITENTLDAVSNHGKNIQVFRDNLLKGITYYKNLIAQIDIEPVDYLEQMRAELSIIEQSVNDLLTLQDVSLHESLY